MKKCRTAATLLFVFLPLWCFATTRIADTAMIRKYLTDITKTGQFRTYKNVDRLDSTAAYIYNVFAQYADTVYYQEYIVKGKTYRNVICSFGPKDKKHIIIGAHYDVCGDQEGADDNASGVVGLLELCRQLQGKKLNYRIDVVAYTLEEPPYFDTEQMGSFVHARSIQENKTPVFGMISLEMIGFFKDEKGSQDYPIKFLSTIYGKRGNYITLVRKFGAGKFAHKFSRKFNNAHTVRTKKFTAPPSLGGIDLSDHANYWHFGISALMITDTSFYRNANYHKATDTMETLDIWRLGGVIDGLAKALTKL